MVESGTTLKNSTLGIQLAASEQPEPQGDHAGHTYFPGTTSVLLYQKGETWQRSI